jgi:hypothetical protein
VIFFFKTLWRKQKAGIHGILLLQNWILMTFVYGVALAPVAVLSKIFGWEMLDMSPPDPEAKTYWQDRDDEPMTLERAQRRF